MLIKQVLIMSECKTTITIDAQKLLSFRDAIVSSISDIEEVGGWDDDDEKKIDAITSRLERIAKDIDRLLKA